MGIPGVSFDGGYADYVVVPAGALAAASPTTSPPRTPLRCCAPASPRSTRCAHSGARAGDLVAVLGVGGLGHLGVQFAAKLGFDTVAIARGTDKEALARELGAHALHRQQRRRPAAELQALGGATVVLSTVTNADAMAATLGGLGARGR